MTTLGPGLATVSGTVTAPARAGTYSCYLALPDPSASLLATPSYSIQLANLGMYDASLGRHDLNMSVTILNSSNVSIGGVMKLTIDGVSKVVKVV